jgi:hypothetical protein
VIEELLICVWHARSMREAVVTGPSWANVEEAIRALNNAGALRAAKAFYDTGRFEGGGVTWGQTC